MEGVSLFPSLSPPSPSYPSLPFSLPPALSLFLCWPKSPACHRRHKQTFPCSLWSRSRQPLGVTDLSLFGAGSFPCILANGGKFLRSEVVPSVCTEMPQSEVLVPVLEPLFISFLPTIKTTYFLSSPSQTSSLLLLLHSKPSRVGRRLVLHCSIQGEHIHSRSVVLL